MIGGRLSAYEVLSELGSGGMGKVWRMFVCVPLLLSLSRHICADEEPDPRLLTVDQAVKRVIEFVETEDRAALESVVHRARLDPWVVAERLCQLGELTAAARYAEVVPKRFGDVGAYVSSHGSSASDADHKTIRDLDVALRLGQWQRVLEMTDTLDALSSVSAIRIAHRRGLALRGMGTHAEAIDVFMQAAKAAERLEWRVGAGRNYHHAGVTAFRTSDLQSAVAAWEAQVPIERMLASRSGLALALTNLGAARSRLGERAAALECFREALTIRRALGDKIGPARVLGNMGVLERKAGDLDAALRHHREEMELYVEAGRSGDVALPHEHLGLVLLERGQSAEARSHFKVALRVHSEHVDDRGAAKASNNLALAERRLGHYDSALRHLHEALRLATKANAPDVVAATNSNLGIVHATLRNHDEAERYIERTLQFARKTENTDAEATAYHNLGKILTEKGDFDAALDRYRHALNLRKQTGDDLGMARLLKNIGLIHARQGRPHKALDQYRKSLRVEQARGDKAGAAATLFNIAKIYTRLGRGDRARAHFEAALEILDGAPHFELQVSALTGLAGLELRAGAPEEALTHARKALLLVPRLAHGLSEEEGAEVRDARAGLFGVGYLAAYRSGDPAELVRWLEAGRASSLRQHLGSREALEAAALPEDLATALAAARHHEQSALAAYRRARRAGGRSATRESKQAWDAARAEVDRLHRKLEREQKHAASVTVSAPAGADQIRGSLAKDESLVYYALTHGEALAVVLRREQSPRVVPLAQSREIESAVDALLDGDRHVDPAKIGTLQSLLVDPLELGAGTARVLVSPMGRLGYVPFALLMPDREVAYTPSGTTHGLLRRDSARRGDKVLGFGDPDYEATAKTVERRARRGNIASLPPLPSTRAEVKAIADVVRVGSAATETELSAALETEDGWRAVHLACHGLLDPESPLRSALALTADERNDGLLTALEVFRMKVRADLTVLSACESGKGSVYLTEGIVGLSRAFMFAGAPRIICSLWKVDDEASRALMVKFYELWNPSDGSKGLGTAEALRRAQAHVRDHPDNDWGHPYYWAAWVLWGLPD